MTEVFIDGVRYVPATDIAPPTVEAFRTELLALCHIEPLTLEKGETTYIIVTDSLPRGYEESPTVNDFITDFVASLAEPN